MIIGITRMYGRVYGVEENTKPLKEEEELVSLKDFYLKAGPVFPSLIDTGHVLGTAMYVKEIPHFILQDRQGLVRYFRSGSSVEMDLLESLIQTLITQSDHPSDARTE